MTKTKVDVHGANLPDPPSISSSHEGSDGEKAHYRPDTVEWKGSEAIILGWDGERKSYEILLTTDIIDSMEVTIP